MAKDKPSPQPQTELTAFRPDLVVNSKELTEHDKAVCCSVILAYFKSLDPGWAAKIEAVQDERHFSDEQCVYLFMANTLDQDQHMLIPADHPFFTPDHMPTGTEGTCPECLKPFVRAYIGQPVCSNDCAKIFYARAQDDQNERTALANDQVGAN